MDSAAITLDFRPPPAPGDPFPTPGPWPTRFTEPLLLARSPGASVFRARDTERGILVAVKAVRRHAVWTAPAGDAIDHPNLVRVLEWFDSQDARCCVMEFVAGPSLAQIIAALAVRRDPRLSSPEPAAPLFAQSGLQPPAWGASIAAALGDRSYFSIVGDWVVGLCRGVAHAHAQGLIHRDIKPSNVLIALDGRAKLADFGIARWPGAGSAPRASTPRYTAPEQLAELLCAQRPPPDPRSDVWGLGLVLYELLTLRPAFEADTPCGALTAIATRDPVSPASLNPAAPPAMVEACLRAVRRDPASRFQSAAAFGETVADALRSLAGPGRRASRTRAGGAV